MLPQHLAGQVIWWRQRQIVALNITGITANNATDKTKSFQYYRGVATVLSLNLQNVLINGYRQYQIPLATAENSMVTVFSVWISRVVNKAQNKLILGTWMRKQPCWTYRSTFDRLGSKSIYCWLILLSRNPKVSTSTVGLVIIVAIVVLLPLWPQMYLSGNNDSKEGSHI